VDAGKLSLAIGVAGLVLFFLDLIRSIVARNLARKFGIHEEVEIQFLPPLLLNFVFIVMLPAVIYAALYPILPFTSFRSGFFIALFIFAVGVLPVQIRNYNQFKLSTVLTAFELFWNLLTLLASIGTITYLYHY
jgi:hypothetical protein